MSTLDEILPLPSSPSSTTYLAELSSLPLETLLAEPTSLQTQSHHLTSSLTTLTHSSYPNLLSVHKSTALLDESLEKLSESLNSLVTESLPALQTTTTAWPSRTDGVLHERANARSVLDLHDKICDLLDIPLLIHTCVRNGFFAEALSLSAHANALADCPNPPPILSSVLADVRASINHMLLSLLSTLHEPNRKVPALWKAVNFLRKMVADDDTDQLLAVIFLSGREGCLAATLQTCGRDVGSLVAGIKASEITLSNKDRDDLARYLKKYTDAWREGVYDIISQFTTIFLDGRSNQTFSNTLLATYASYALSTHLLPVIRNLLPHLLAYLPSFLTQLTYCATAFARVGLDFRSLLPSIFCDAVVHSTRSQLDVSVSAFEQKCKTASSTLTSTRNPSPKHQLPSAWLADANASSVAYNASASVHAPPAALTSYLPLAELLNAFLTMFNAIRQLAPVEIVDQLVELVNDALARCGAALLSYIETLSTEEIEKELEVIEMVGDAYFRVVVPYTRRALVEGIYGHPVTGDVGDDEETGRELRREMEKWENWSTTRGGSS